MAGAKIALSSTTGELKNDGSGNALVTLPQVDAQTGKVRMMSENDAGGITGDAYLRGPETSPDYRLRVGVDTVLFADHFNSTTQNTNLWAYTFSTLTASMPGAGTLNFSTVQGTTLSHGAFLRTWQYFPLVNTAPLAVEFYGGSFNSALVANEVVLFGFGLPGGVTTEPTDGVWFRLTSAGYEGVLRFNGSSTTLTPDTTVAAPLSTIRKLLIIVGEREVEFWIDDELIGHIDIPAANGIPWLASGLPLFMMKYNTGSVTNTNTYRFSRVGVTLLDAATTKPWAHVQSGMGAHISVGQNGATMGTTAGNFGQSAYPATSAGANTGSNVNGVGGVGIMTAQATNRGAAGDMIATSALNPAQATNISGKNWYITGVAISCANAGAAVATTPTTLIWGLAFGNTAISLATAESGSFVSATAHAPRRIPLGICSAPVGTAVGGTYDKEIVRRFTAPIVVRPGEYLQTTVRFLVGTATASQEVVYTVTFDGYVE